MSVAWARLRDRNYRYRFRNRRVLDYSRAIGVFHVEQFITFVTSLQVIIIFCLVVGLSAAAIFAVDNDD